MCVQAITVARKAAGMTQAALALRLGVTPEYISMLESGRRRLSPSLAAIASACLRIPVLDLLYPDGLPPGAVLSPVQQAGEAGDDRGEGAAAVQTDGADERLVADDTHVGDVDTDQAKPADKAA